MYYYTTNLYFVLLVFFCFFFPFTNNFPHPTVLCEICSGGCTGIRQYCVNSITSLSFDSPMLALMQKREEPTSTINTNIAARGCLPKTFLLRRCLILGCCLFLQSKHEKCVENAKQLPFSNNAVTYQYLSNKVMLVIYFFQTYSFS